MAWRKGNRGRGRGRRGVKSGPTCSLHLVSFSVVVCNTQYSGTTLLKWGDGSLVPRPLPDFISQLGRKFLSFLHSCEIKSGSGLGMRLGRLTSSEHFFEHKVGKGSCDILSVFFCRRDVITYEDAELPVVLHSVSTYPNPEVPR